MKTERALRARAKRNGVPYKSPYTDPLPSPPELLPDSADAWELFAACSTQLIVGGLSGVFIGVKHDTLYAKMDVRGVPIEERYDLEQKFIHLEHLYTKHLNRKSDSGDSKGNG